MVFSTVQILVNVSIRGVYVGRGQSLGEVKDHHICGVKMPNHHYENTPIQIYRKFFLQILKIFR